MEGGRGVGGCERPEDFGVGFEGAAARWLGDACGGEWCGGRGRFGGGWSRLDV